MKDIDNILLKQNQFLNSEQLLDIKFRVNCLKSLLSVIEKYEADICAALKSDFYKPEFETYATEILFVKKELKLTIKNLKKWAKPKRIKSSLLNFPSRDYIYQQAYGRVLIISPWNYPFQLALSPLIGAVAAGNTVVLKPSEHAPNTSELLQKILSKVFHEHHVSCVLGDTKVAQELLSRTWNYIFFTGSTKVGKIVAKSAAQNLTPVTLELGGKNPCIVHKDAPIQLSAKRIAWGKFVNAGQTCIAPDYLLVHKSIKKGFIEALETEIQQRYGNSKTSADYPRIINATHFKRLEDLMQYQNIISGGATDVNDLYFSPTLINEPSFESPLMQGEIFGPILPVLSYESEGDLKQVITKFDEPLALYVFSSNNEFVEHTLSSFSFGGGAVNDVMVQFVNHRLPFGGVGNSGMGAYHGNRTFETFSHQKAITKRGTWLDVPLRYAPYSGKLKWLKRFF